MPLTRSRNLNPWTATAANCVALIALIVAPVAAQAESAWILNPNVPSAEAVAGSYYPTRFTVHHADGEGGHVQARVHKPGKAACTAQFDYKWTFASPLDVAHQGDIIEVKYELTANPTSDCAPPLDPQMAVTPVKGTINNKEIAGTFLNGEETLLLWHPQTPPYLGRINLPTAQGGVEIGEIAQLKVDDTRSATGKEFYAQRGGFKVTMGYRGAMYEPNYIFSAQ